MLRFSVSLADYVLGENKRVSRSVLFYCPACTFLRQGVLRALLSRTLDGANMQHCCARLKKNRFSGTLSTEKREIGAEGGINHSTLHNMLCL